MTRMCMKDLLSFALDLGHVPTGPRCFWFGRPDVCFACSVYSVKRTQRDVCVDQRLAHSWMAQGLDLLAPLPAVHGLEVIALARMTSQFRKSRGHRRHQLKEPHHANAIRKG